MLNDYNSDMNIPDSRDCTKCGCRKRLVEFSRAPRGLYGRKASCKACDAARHAAQYIPRPRGGPRRAPFSRDMLKTCNKCQQTKRLAEFNLSRKAAGMQNAVYRSDCKRCSAETYSKWYAKNIYTGLPNKRNTKHGMEGTPTYTSWQAMLSRCCNPNQTGYEKYGGKGITVCARWHDFVNFYADMGDRPEGTTIDRVDNNRGYSPANCRWATWPQQARNRSNTKLTGKDITKIRAIEGRTQRSIAVEFGVSQSTISQIRGFKRWGDHPE